MSNDRAARIRWRCRRGTRELDVLLGRFVERRLSDLDESGLALLERVLLAQDPDLHAWLTGATLPGDPALDAFVLEMRAAVDGR